MKASDDVNDACEAKQTARINSQACFHPVVYGVSNFEFEMTSMSDNYRMKTDHLYT